MHLMPLRQLADRQLLDPPVSNSSTLDRTIPDLHADNIDMKIRTRVGPTFATTRRTHQQRDHHPGGANIRDDQSTKRGQFR
jgi:hypothetical protein